MAGSSRGDDPFASFILRRAVGSVLVFFAVAILVFAMIHLAQVAEIGIAGSVEHARHILGVYRSVGVDVPILAPFTNDPADVDTGYRSFSVDAYTGLADLVGW